MPTKVCRLVLRAGLHSTLAAIGTATSQGWALATLGGSDRTRSRPCMQALSPRLQLHIWCCMWCCVNVGRSADLFMCCVARSIVHGQCCTPLRQLTCVCASALDLHLAIVAGRRLCVLLHKLVNDCSHFLLVPLRALLLDNLQGAGCCFGNLIRRHRQQQQSKLCMYAGIYYRRISDCDTQRSNERPSVLDSCHNCGRGRSIASARPQIPKQRKRRYQQFMRCFSRANVLAPCHICRAVLATDCVTPWSMISALTRQR